MMSVLVCFIRFFFLLFDFGFMVDEFKLRLEKEIDFEVEGWNCEWFGLVFVDDVCIDILEVFWDLIICCVLMMEFIDGEKLTNIEGMREKGFDFEYVVFVLSDCFVCMFFVYGYIYGDFYFGNLFCCVYFDGSG